MIEYLFLVAGIIVITRGITGPTFADRLLSVNTLTSIFVMLLVILSVTLELQMYMDIAIVLTMLSFVGTLAVAKFSRPEEGKK